MREVSGDPGDNLERLGSFVRSRGIQLAYNENIAPARMTSLAKTQFRLLSGSLQLPANCYHPHRGCQPLKSIDMARTLEGLGFVE